MHLVTSCHIKPHSAAPLLPPKSHTMQMLRMSRVLALRPRLASAAPSLAASWGAAPGAPLFRAFSSCEFVDQNLRPQPLLDRPSR